MCTIYAELSVNHAQINEGAYRSTGLMNFVKLHFFILHLLKEDAPSGIVLL